MFRSLITQSLKNPTSRLILGKTFAHSQFKIYSISNFGFHNSKHLFAETQTSGDKEVGYYYINAVNPERSIPPKDGQPRKKLTTGLVGLAVVENWREVLIDLYTQILRDIEIIPPEVTYRKSLESLVKYRLNIVKSTDDYEVVERTIQYGQVEELILDAQSDLKTIPRAAEDKFWEIDPDVVSTPILYLDILRDYERSLQASPGAKSAH